MLKEIEQKMLSELIKNSRRSDRERAKAIGASQPTATRIRTKLEKEGFVKEYTAVPNFSKAGYKILAITFMKLDVKTSLPENNFAEFRKIHYQVFEKDPNALLFVKRGMGLGYDAVIISLHQDYAACDRFRTFMRTKMSERITDMDTFLINLDEEENSIPFSFNLLASQMLLLPTKSKLAKE